MTRGPGAALLTICALALAGGLAAAGDGASTPAPRPELLVKFAPGASTEGALDAVGATAVQRLRFGGVVRAKLDPGVSLAEAHAALERRSDVVFAEPNREYELYAAPNDAFYDQLWGLPKIGAPTAWDVTQGDPSLAVAVVDTGVDTMHRDLDANIWTNPGETANGLDDDANGLVDDLKGWDFFANDADAMDEHGHGTHVAGTIGAEGNNGVDVTGVNWNVKVLPLRTGNLNLSGAAIEQAFRYACSKGARVVNGSFGSPGFDPFVSDAIADCPNTLFVFAAGNESSNNDSAPRYPCNDPSPNVVCVAATGQDDTLASFSNFGVNSVDLAAPGVDIASTIPADDLGFSDGTSMASPHVAGAAALVLADRPTLTPLQLKSALLLSVEPKPSLAGLVKTGGRLNVAQALGQEVKPPIGLTASSPSHTGAWSANPIAQVVWGGATDESGIGGYSFAFSPVHTFEPDEVKDVEASTTTLMFPLADGVHWFHIRARDSEGNWGAAVHVGPILIDTFQPVRPVPSSSSHRLGAVSADRTIDAAWSGASDAQSGLDGYSYSWTLGRAAAADTVKDAEETAFRATSPTLGFGAWWFNIRAKDNAGNWSDTVSIGPFSLKTTPARCAVPRLRGLTLAAAKRVLVKKGCRLGRVTRARSGRVRRGRVVAQKPAPGLRLARGARVRIVLSKGRR